MILFYKNITIAVIEESKYSEKTVGQVRSWIWAVNNDMLCNYAILQTFGCVTNLVKTSMTRSKGDVISVSKRFNRHLPRNTLDIMMGIQNGNLFTTTYGRVRAPIIRSEFTETWTSLTYAKKSEAWKNDM